MTESKICTCPSGDGSLRWPCPAHPAVDQADVAAKLTFINGRPAMCGCQVEYSDGGGEYSDVIYVTLCAKHSGSAILDIVATNRIALTQSSPAHELDPLGPAPHAEAFNEAPDEAIRPEQAEAERPEVVAYFDRNYPSTGDAFIWSNYEGSPYEPVMTVAQHDRIVGALRADAQRWREQFDCMQLQRNHHRDRANAALARVAELEGQEPVAYRIEARDERGIVRRDCLSRTPFNEGLPDARRWAGNFTVTSTPLYAAPVALAQHSLPEGWMLVECGIWTQEQVDEMQKTVARFRNSEFVDDRALAMAVADAGQCKAPEISLAELLAAAPGKEVPQAWLDVQAERRRQITAEGWTPEHDDQHGAGELADAAACYALWAGGINPGNWREFWPWAPEWLKHSEPRRMLVKACALALAEIERLDRAAPGKEGGDNA
ncbi:hypothetical protein [Pseudomonas aeruginosa]|uniref:Uncharacterized protein n=2 Tax=root TaxID=1 RepID=A0AAX4B1N3_9CAUD|nr:hypothetical protein [Pseudomonas aeruginosa]WNL50565.1 hypothetical protein [Pseudomonas phage Riah]EZO00872.1 hypothetical protein AJ65_06159 [Pseudomonas aeruginosa 3578]MCO3555999.1 hypothetical protein [Pseudomonas aeruginosa]MCS9339700.1 hypothetical protein [Pseudomonas aeruginosa]MCS9372356.1 hypothetical protein [Pseudomonas aeruginosa]